MFKYKFMKHCNPFFAYCNWDKGDQQSDGGGHTCRTRMIQMPIQKSMPMKQVYGVQITPVGKPLSNEKSMQPQTVVVVDKTVEPLYHHRSHHRLTIWLERLHEENKTISGYWHINGIPAHCLLDSGSEGIMISPDFTRVTNMKTFMLEQPNCTTIGLCRV